jgi:hypothetical protein
MAFQYTFSNSSVFFIKIYIHLDKFVKYFKICEELKTINMLGDILGNVFIHECHTKPILSYAATHCTFRLKYSDYSTLNWSFYLIRICKSLFPSQCRLSRCQHSYSFPFYQPRRRGSSLKLFHES